MVLSERVAVAVNWRGVYIALLGLSGVRAMAVTVAAVTVKVVLVEILPEVAVIVAEPTATAVAIPLLALIVATVVSDELHVAVEVKSLVVLSENVPVAVS